MQPYSLDDLADLDPDTLAGHARALANAYRHADHRTPDRSGPYGVRVRGRTRAGRLARLQCAHWWRRRLKQRQRQAREYRRLLAGMVGADADRYASRSAVTDDQERRRRTLEWASRQALQGPSGQRAPLLPMLEQAAERRYAELIAWTRGLDDYATAAGMVPVLVTLTLPPEWHPNPSQGRSSWSGADPRDAAAELSRRWDRLSRELRRRLSPWYALRVREPHADACPHDHLITYVLPDEVHHLQEIVAEHFPGRSGDVEQITDARGSTYATKYIAKHTHGKTGDASDATEAARTCRTIWTMRTFAFIGLPRGARTLYRIMRRLGPLEHPHDRAMQDAAQAGRVAEFLSQLQTPSPAVLTETRTDRYGDPLSVATGIITSDGEALSLPRYEIVPAADLPAPLPSYDELAKGGAPATGTPASSEGLPPPEP